MTAWQLMGAALLSGAGALARFGVDEAVRRRTHRITPFPAGILVVNVSGAFVAGLLAAATLPEATALLLLGGLLGGYTTFSTWMLDAVFAAQDRLPVIALLNLAGSLASGFAAAALGWAIAGG